MPITIQNSAGGGVTLDSTTTSNETLQLPSGGGTLAPLASPSFTGNVGIGASSPSEKLSVLGGHVSIGESSGSSATKMLLEGYREIYSGSKYGNISIRSTYNTTTNASDMLFYTAPSGTTSTERMRIDNEGRLLVGKTSSVFATAGTEIKGHGEVNITRDAGIPLYINRTSNNGTVVDFRRDGVGVGSIYLQSSAAVFVTSSDYRLKTDVQPMTGATDRVKLLKPCNFEWIADGTRVDGFLAHEAQEVVPESVVGTKDAMMDEEYEVTAATDTEAAVMGTRSVPDMQGIDQSKLVPLLTATIQELIARIEALENV